MIYVMRFGYLVLKRLLHVNKHCAKTNIVPGWNDYVKEAHTEARYYYILWRDMGKPKHGPVCELMRKTRLHFKYMLKQCQQHEDMARADAMAKSMQAKDADSFLKKVSKTYKKGIPNATNVNGANDPTAISATLAKVSRSVCVSIRNIGMIRKHINQPVTELLTHARITSKPEKYNSLLHGLNKTQLKRLQRLQNTVARLVTLSRKCTHITPIRKQL